MTKKKSKFSSTAPKISVGFCIFLFVKAELDVICSLSKGNGGVVRCKCAKGRVLFCSKAKFHSANKTSEVIFSMRSRIKACELTE